ncbi:MAG: hypothetical protein WKF37_00240 [Bryobacteraceae bacterium]
MRILTVAAIAAGILITGCEQRNPSGVGHAASNPDTGVPTPSPDPKATERVGPESNVTGVHTKSEKSGERPAESKPSKTGVR